MNKRPPRLDLNPSSADRWTTCTASPRFILENWDKVPSSDTVYNQEGTTAHEVASAYLLNKEPDQSKCPSPIDADMRWHGWNYAEYVIELCGKNPKLIVEQKLPLWYMKERNAIVDAAVLNEDSLHVVDYKYGEGVVVHPENNLQAAIYAISVGLTRGVPIPSDFPVFIHIYQPRGRGSEDGAAHVWETTWLEVCKLTEKVTDVAKGIQDGTEIPMFAPSDKACQWCPAKGFCKARQDSMLEGLDIIEAQPRPLPLATVLTLEQRAVIQKHKADIVSWLNDVEDYNTERMRAGEMLPGFKLVTSRGGNRYWSDPKKAAALLLKDTVLKREEVIEEKVAGPAAIEKLLGKKKFSVELTNLITKNPGVPVIAPESDKREAIGNALTDFEVLLEQTTKTENHENRN